MSLLYKVAASALAAGIGIVGAKTVDRQTQESKDRLYEQRVREVIGTEGMSGLHARMSGWVQGFGSYELVSFNKGQTWWGVSEEGATLTAADPKLIATLRGWDALVARAEACGPINPSQLSGEDLKLLAGAGLGVSGNAHAE